MYKNENEILHVLLNLIRGLHKAIDEDWRKAAAKSGLTVSQQHLLWILNFENGSTLSEISEYGLWHLSTVMDLVERMEKAGLVHKEVDQSDARTKRVYITDKGREVLNSTAKRIDNYKFLDVVYNERTKDLLAERINMLYNLNKAFHGEKFVNYVEQSTNRVKEVTQ
ncbi:MarR family transcriptional regulator [Peptococcaceae bacterium 1198_IL3148]